jgi:hypothetical protein
VSSRGTRPSLTFTKHGSLITSKYPSSVRLGSDEIHDRVKELIRELSVRLHGRGSQVEIEGLLRSVVL